MQSRHKRHKDIKHNLYQMDKIYPCEMVSINDHWKWTFSVINKVEYFTHSISLIMTFKFNACLPNTLIYVD